MDRCSVEEPELRSVAGGAGHRSACWLPPGIVGTDEVTQIERRLAGGRGQVAA